MSEEASNIKSILRLKLNDEVQISNDYGSQIEDLSSELSNKLDKRTGGEISGDISSTNDIYAAKHGLVGHTVDFNSGGDYNFAVGHDHRFYGKESFIAGNEGNIVGAKAFHWKAIDTTNNLIYLTHEQTTFNGAELSSTSFFNGNDGDYTSKSDYVQYDIPYFGPRSGSYLSAEDNISCLFTTDDQISIVKSAAIRQTLLLNNVLNQPYFGKIIVKDVLSGSVLSVEGLDSLSSTYKQTHYRKNTKRDYHANHYFVCFPDNPNISTLVDSGWERSMTFGCAAIGENNNTIGYNSFAIGKDNRTEGNYSIALGYNACVKNNNSFAWNYGSNGKYESKGEGTFCINPKDGALSNVYIGSQNLDYIITNKYISKTDGGVISNDVGITGVLSIGSNIFQGNSLTSGIGVGDSSGNPSEVEMSAVHGAAFNSSKAFGLSSFAANKGNAYAKYSAAFNDGTAYSSYSLAHGTKTSAFGYVSHVEGEYTQTGLPEQIGNDSTRKTGAFSHAEGDHAKAIGLASHAEGFYTYTLSTASQSHAEGNSTSAVGITSHAEGDHTKTIGLASHTEGLSTYALLSGSHAEGNQTSAFGIASHAEGYMTNANGNCSHAEGGEVSALGKASHAEGYKTKAAGDNSHAEGDSTYAEGPKSHAEGGEVSALGFASHAEGRSTIARARYSHAEGANSEVLSTDSYSFVWSGKYNPHSIYYKSHGEGSFSINPKEGTNGFFIGTESLSSIISTAIHDAIDPIAQEFNELNDLADEILT